MTMSLDLLLDELQAAYLIHPVAEPEPSFLFNHVLMQEAAYHSLLMKERREYHLLVAAAFEQVYAERLDECAPTLAYHYWQGEDWPRAAKFARRAGDRALRVYALREAMGHYMRTLQALERIPNGILNASEETCDAILGWAEAALAFEPYPKQLELLARAEQLARRLGDKRRLALTLHAIGQVHVASGHASRAEGPLIECFTLATELGDDRLAVFPTFCMGMVTFDADPRRSLSYFDRAAELARKYGDVDTEAYALSAGAMVRARLGETTEARQSMEQALHVVGRATSPMTVTDVYLYVAWAWLDLGDAHRALEYAQLGVQKAISADNMECACIGYACLGFGHLRAEQMAEAVLAFEEAIRRSSISGAEEAQIIAESGLGMAHLFSGEPHAVLELEDALAHARKTGKQFIAAQLALTLAELSLKAGEAERSRTYLNDALDYYRRNRMRPYLARAQELLAQASEGRGEQEKINQAQSERTESL